VRCDHPSDERLDLRDEGAGGGADPHGGGVDEAHPEKGPKRGIDGDLRHEA
jgi:hypothetical protein